MASDFATHRLIVCLGPGGAGKTTLSAALGLHAALTGRDTDLMTIDPAPRLLELLGIGEDAATPTPVKLCERGAGRLRAMRLDPKRTFDDLVARYAPSPAARDAILAGRIYQSLSEALAGVGDYMAMERMLALHQAPEMSLLVLDTPPAIEALKFLGAPRRMLELLDSRAAALLGATRGLLRAPRAIFDFAARAVLAAFDRVTGLHLLSDVHEFVRSFEGMYEGFAARARLIEEILRSPTTAIVLITTAEPARITQSGGFIQDLHRMGLRVNQVIVNRLLPQPPNPAELKGARLSSPLICKLEQSKTELETLRQRESRELARLVDSTAPQLAIFGVEDLGREPQSLAELSKLAAQLRPLRL